MDSANRRTLQELLIFLYGEETGTHTTERLLARLEAFTAGSERLSRQPDELFDECDVIAITYGDLLRREGEPPLETLREFLSERLSDVVNTVHILPFYPYTSDDGFSITDYTAVNPALGTWADVEGYPSAGLHLMVDAVINHISASSAWFEGFKAGDPRYRDRFITVDPSTDLSHVTRPRALPLLTPVETVLGTEYVWTTFSTDQIDLNYESPDTLLDVIDVLLAYIGHGAEVIRLDAIAYLWKEIGTTCIHLPQTHAVVKLLRAIVDAVAPGTLLITETNVPHAENVSYFGDGSDEAHMVYNFSLPPLTAHAILTGSAETLTAWASTLKAPSLQTTFFNFTASHDGIGVRPATGLLDQAGLGLLLDRTRAGGGTISFMTNEDGTTSPYELNITYFDLLNAADGEQGQARQVDRFLTSQAIMLALAGVPGIYLHSLLGSRNDRAAVERTGQARAINRERLALPPVEAALADPSSLRYQVFSRYHQLIEARTTRRAFHPNGPQQVLNLHPAIFAVLRHSPEGDEALLALHNVSGEPVTLTLNLPALNLAAGDLTDLLTGEAIDAAPADRMPITLAPYQVRWLSAD